MFERFSTKENASMAMNMLNIFLYEIMFLATLMMGYIHYFFYYSRGYLVFFLLYLFLYFIFAKLFDAFEVGNVTTTDLFLSTVLTLLLVNFTGYWILCLITLRLIPAWPILIMQIVEAFLTAFLLFLENRYIRRNFPPVKTAKSSLATGKTLPPFWKPMNSSTLRLRTTAATPPSPCWT